MNFPSRLTLPSLGAFLTLALRGAAADAAPAVWAVDDGEKIKEDASSRAGLAVGESNPIWSPGAPIRLFAMKNETVAFQIVVAADDAPLSGVTVDLAALSNGDATIANAKDATDPTRFVGRSIERFVEHVFDVPRASGGKDPGESLGWERGAAPSPGAWTGRLPDALVPVEVAPPWSPYPLEIAPRKNGMVWIDVTVDSTRPAGVYRGTVIVKSKEATLASLPVELDVLDAVLPERPVRTMLYFHASELEKRMGASAAPAAKRHLFQLLHRHRISPLHGALSAPDVTAAMEALDGSLYTAKNGYAGPGEAMGDGVLAIGTYGTLGEPDATKLRAVEAIAEVLAQRELFATTDAFVYAMDEDCRSPFATQWKKLLATSANPHAKRLRVGWTCSEAATTQPVDVVIQHAAFDAKETAKARRMGKEVWAYNGHLPQTGSFLTDTPATSPRVNGWLSAMLDIGRWYYWESTFWFDWNKGGRGPYDPLVTAETFHNADGDWAMGDGVLVYPGRQVEPFASHSIGIDGVLASIRLKNWRRGIEDAGYVQLARAAAPEKADAIVKALFPRVMSDAPKGAPASWPERGKPFFDARKSLAALVPRGTNGGPGLGAKPGAATSPPSLPAATERGCGFRGCQQAGTGLLLGLSVLVARRVRRRGA
ncbi:MAG: DUF4091 domain-containing protein [Deltaproteobacteria bacterium]|nr:DUF4091 domain-containing protein [Deltaproteobacteria bacterium]